MFVLFCFLVILLFCCLFCYLTTQIEWPIKAFCHDSVRISLLQGLESLLLLSSVLFLFVCLFFRLKVILRGCVYFFTPCWVWKLILPKHILNWRLDHRRFGFVTYFHAAFEIYLVIINLSSWHGLLFSQFENLEKPYATNCTSKKLKTFPTYTPEGCVQECRAEKTINECKCRIPGYQGNIYIYETCTNAESSPLIN